MRRSPCSRSTSGRCSARRRTGTNGASRPPGATSAKALLLFRRTIAALKQAQATGEDGVAVVDREVGLKQLDDTLPIIGAVAGVADQDILVTAAERYSVLRRFS